MSSRPWRQSLPGKLRSRESIVRLWRHSGGRCEYCRRLTTLPPSRAGGGDFERDPGGLYATRDHCIPRALGGDNSPGNVALACEPCNNLKGNMDWPVWRAFMRDNPQWWETAPSKGHAESVSGLIPEASNAN